MWKVIARLQPEQRVTQEIPIEEVVHEYGIAVATVREWIDERGIQVPFQEYAYFHAALFELTAESVRRYALRQAELVSQRRAEYLAAVMHQLRTPLSTLSLTLEYMERHGRPPDAETVGKLRRTVRRIRFLVDGVLRLERFRPEEVPVRPAEVHPARLIDEIMSDFEPDALRKGLRFEAHVNRTLRITVDPDLFADVLGNFVQNAVKYTSAGSVVVEAEEHADAVTFRVRDTGPGIPEHLAPGLLTEVQAGTAGGAGIGLKIAQHATAAQGGEIGFESQPGKGSVFWARMPRRVAPRGGEPPPQEG